MSDALLETICISGTRPPYKRPAWVIGQVGSEEMQRRTQTATPRESRDKQIHSSTENRRPKKNSETPNAEKRSLPPLSTPCRLNVSFNEFPNARSLLCKSSCWHLNEKSREVCIKARSPPASLAFTEDRCPRWRQVYSAKDRKSLEESPNDDSMTITLAPGYVLSRTKEKINVTITDDFFKDGNTKAKTRKKYSKILKKAKNKEELESNPLVQYYIPHLTRSQPPDEKDIVIQQLHQQIDDLTLVCEEERLNHKMNHKKTEDNHRLHIEQIHDEHREHIKSIERDHDEEMEELKNSYDEKLHEERRTAEVEKARLQGEMDCLQGAFRAYKDTVAIEMDYKWQRREKELRNEHERRTEGELSKQRKEMLHEKNKEIDGMNKEFQRQIQVLVEDHKKQVDHLMEKFAECVQDSEQLKSALLEMQTLKQKKQELEEKLKTKSEILRKTQMELEDKAVKLAAFEEHFAEKVEEVDNRYSMRMQGLMSDNTDLRRHYIKKCEEFFKLKTEQDVEQESSIRTAKNTMQAIILARTRCDVSLTALRDESPDDIQTPELSMRKKRPMSAPGTRDEISTAEKLTSMVNKNTAPTTTPRISAQKSQPNKRRPHTSHHPNLFSPRNLSTSARSGTRESLVPTPVNVSNQGLQNMSTQREFLS